MRRIDALHLDYPCPGSRMLRDLLRREAVVIGREMVRTMMRRPRIEALYQPLSRLVELVGGLFPFGRSARVLPEIVPRPLGCHHRMLRAPDGHQRTVSHFRRYGDRILLRHKLSIGPLFE
jgi:hypothetical protein